MGPACCTATRPESGIEAYNFNAYRNPYIKNSKIHFFRHFFTIFSGLVGRSWVKSGVAVNKLAASAASAAGLQAFNFQAMIKSAASAASPEGFGRGKAMGPAGPGPQAQAQGPGPGPGRPFLFQMLPARLR